MILENIEKPSDIKKLKKITIDLEILVCKKYSGHFY